MRPYAWDFPRLLRIGCERRHEDAEDERHDEPDGIVSHDALPIST